MLRRIPLIAALAALLAFTAACTNKKSINPLAGVGSKQPDKVLFDKAMDAMRHNRFDVARLTLQTLINTYPDSEFIARAKLAVGDSWYAEGGAAALAQAEQEYSDFEIFFPNMPEAAEAQLKIANIHYQQMEKPDRDYTHAKRAEDEYRKVILQYPDSKLVPEAKQRLLEVQEVLAEREFEIGRFYYLRQSYPASIARLQSLVEKYPLYSRADEALYLLGQDYEGQIARIRLAPTCDKNGLPRGCAYEEAKSRYIGDLTKKASLAYDQILTRYPLMDRSDDAKKRLLALHQTVPRPTRAMVAQNKAEMDSRSETSMAQRFMGLIKKGPDVSEAAKVGNPPLVDPEPIAAKDVIRNEAFGAAGLVDPGNNKMGVDIIKPDQPKPTDTATSSDQPSVGGGSPFGKSNSTAQSPVADPNELKPNVPADPNELTPTNGGTDASLPPPVQVNEIQQGQSGSTASAAAKPDASALATDQEISSSKKKRKKGLKKLDPF
ncbi:MAG TPA: outer membrane protein assembly factor BamD [Candidatus Acidoferrales bacterium]|nr:outer membrane protein assembly factor BamD [Candidatus Acidoferrales bacterium]